MNELMLTLAVSDYDHTADIVSGRVKPEGITLRPLDLQIEEIFYRFTLFQEWDLCEMSFGKYVSMISQNAPVTALPVFISRVFRHSSFFVRKDGPVKTPADLKGARLGLPEWAQTASIYSRGLLQHTYGLDLASIQWVQAGINQKGRVEKVELKLPPGVSIERHPDKTLSDMLERGEVDAVMVARPPNAFLRGHPNIKRMFENYRELEADYYRETGIFPVFEAEHGEVTAVTKIRHHVPVEEYLKSQKRFAHLFGKPGQPEMLAQIQADADRNIRRFNLMDTEA